MKHMRTHHSLSVCFERMIIFIARGGKGGGGVEVRNLWGITLFFRGNGG